MIRRLLIVILLALAGAIPLNVALAVPTTCTEPPGGSTDLLYIVILAFDNNRTTEIDGFTVDNPLNLTQYYTDTVANLEAASTGLGDRQTIVLADLDGAADTHILLIGNGAVTQLDCLPNVSGVLAEIDEYDVTDGDTLGGFLQWARGSMTANRTIVSYIGHGLAFAPEVGAPHSTLFDDAEGRAGGISPLPDRIQVNPDLTDHNLPGSSESSLITLHDLAVALSQATSGGADPIDVLDLTHCFAATIEELYEVHEYATFTTGSPNYAYFSPEMPSTAFAAFNPAGPVSDLAEALIDATASVISGSGSPAAYPFAVMALQNEMLGAVKSAWDNVATELLAFLKNSPTTGLNALDLAYVNSRKYDTTYCEPADYQLAPPDALSDMFSFAEELTIQFPGTSIADQAAQTQIALMDALPFAQRVGDGSPYFANDNPQWEFGEEPYPGVFTPFDTWTAPSGDVYHTWQSLWYTDSLNYELPPAFTVENPRPYRFIQGETTWADLVATYWNLRSERPGVDVDTALCTPYFPTVFDGFTDLRTLASGSARGVATGEPISYTISIVNVGASGAVRPLVTHELSPLTTLIAAPAFCQQVGERLGCVPPEPIRGDGSYQFSVRALLPGTATMTTTVTADNAEAASATTVTTISGTPLAIGTATVSATQPAVMTPLLAVGLLLWLLVIAKRKRLRRSRSG